jgi:hypothetical protein
MPAGLMNHFYHASVRLDWLDAQPDSVINGMFSTKQSHNMSVSEIRRLTAEKMSEGYEVLPGCENHNDLGYCKGCEDVDPACDGGLCG